MGFFFKNNDSKFIQQKKKLITTQTTERGQQSSPSPNNQPYIQSQKDQTTGQEVPEPRPKTLTM